MSAAVSPIPPGYHTLTPHLIVSDAKQAAEFYHKAFGAELRGMAYAPDGKVIHAEVKIGDSILMFNDEIPAYGVVSPTTTKASTCVTNHMYVEDADKVFAAALAAGAKVIRPLQDQFWGDRYGTVEDPFGHHWSIATHIKDQTPEEMKVAMDEALAKMASHEVASVLRRHVRVEHASSVSVFDCNVTKPGIRPRLSCARAISFKTLGRALRGRVPG